MDSPPDRKPPAPEPGGQVLPGGWRLSWGPELWESNPPTWRAELMWPTDPGWRVDVRFRQLAGFVNYEGHQVRRSPWGEPTTHPPASSVDARPGPPSREMAKATSEIPYYVELLDALAEKAGLLSIAKEHGRPVKYQSVQAALAVALLSDHPLPEPLPIGPDVRERHAAARKGFTRREVAELLGISPRTVTRLVDKAIACELAEPRQMTNSEDMSARGSRESPRLTDLGRAVLTGEHPPLEVSPAALDALGAAEQLNELPTYDEMLNDPEGWTVEASDHWYQLEMAASGRGVNPAPTMTQLASTRTRR
jgi:hypothetical protein